MTQVNASSSATVSPVARSISSATLPRLPLPAAAARRRILWSYAIPITAVHLLALVALLPWLFSWTGVIAMLLGIHVFGQGITLCYHRLLAHRSFKVPTWLERLFVVIALCSMQDSPAKWVAIHRLHHNHSDEQEDPHTPLANFLWSHIGWLFIDNPGARSLSVYQKYARDLLYDPFYMYLEKHPTAPGWIYLGHAALFAAAGALVGWFTAGTGAAALQMALSLVVWGVIVRTVAVWHITWSVNSLTHLFGYRNHETGEYSRNNWFVALLTVGEGWHNNHHHDPAGASVQHRWWEIDITYYEIKLLEKLGLAWDVNPAKPQRRAARSEAENVAPPPEGRTAWKGGAKSRRFSKSPKS